MTAFHKYDCFAYDLGLARHNFSTDTLKVAYTNRAPDLTNDKALADIVEIGAGNGYVAGGAALSVDTWAEVAGVAKLVASNDDTITASGGNIGPFRYEVLYNSTPAGKYLIGYWDKGVAITLYDPDFSVTDLDQSAGVFTVT